MAGDIEVKHYTFQITTNSETSSDVTISEVDLTKTRLLFNNSHNWVLPLSSPAFDDATLSCCIELLNSTTVRVHHGSVSPNRFCRFETWEYVGLPGGPNSFQILDRGTFTMGVGVDLLQQVSDTIYPTATTTDISITDLGGMLDSNSTGLMGEYRINVRVFLFFGLHILQWIRGATTKSILMSWEVIEWTGSNWNVQGAYRHTNRTGYSFANPGVTETDDILDVGDWDTAWIEITRSADDHDSVNSSTLAWPGPSTTEINVREGTLGGTGTFDECYWFVFQNDDVYVDHKGVDYTGASVFPVHLPAPVWQANIVTPETPASLVDDYERQSMIGTVQSEGVSNGVYERYAEAPQLFDTGTTVEVRWFRSDSDFEVEWHQQIIQFPERFERFAEITGSIDIDATTVGPVKAKTADVTGTVEIDATTVGPVKAKTAVVAASITLEVTTLLIHKVVRFMTVMTARRVLVDSLAARECLDSILTARREINSTLAGRSGTVDLLAAERILTSTVAAIQPLVDEVAGQRVDLTTVEARQYIEDLLSAREDVVDTLDAKTSSTESTDARESETDSVPAGRVR